MSQPFAQFNERRHEVLELLRLLNVRAKAVGLPTLSARVERDLIEKLDEDRFHLVVVGEFNHGKTSFVNALLGRNALPVGVTPTTALIHHVRYAPEASARIVYRNGDDKKMGIDALSSFVASELDEAATGELAPGGAAPNRTGPNKTGEGGPAGASTDDDAKVIDFLEVSYPAELLKERIVLVDTPGVNDLCLQRSDITYKYIPQADAVLFVIDAGQPLKESERVFLKEKLIGQSRDKIIFVVAKSDIWSPEEHDEALAYVKEELAKIVEGPVVFPISAEKHLEGDEAAGGFAPLVTHLTNFLADERGRIVLDNAVGDGLAALRSVSNGIEARRRAIEMSAEDLRSRIVRIEKDMAGQDQTIDERRGAIREEVAAVRAWVRRDLDRFCDDVIRQLPRIVETATVEELRLHLPGFLESTFVDWAQREADEVAAALELLAETTVVLMKENAHEAAKRLGATAGADVTAPDIDIDTFGYDLGVAALFSVGMGMVLTNALLLGALMAGAAPVLAYYLKGRIETETKAKAQEQAALALREAVSKVGPKLDVMIVDFGERLEKWVIQAGKEVHREMLDVLRSVSDEHDATEPNVEHVAAQCKLWQRETGELKVNFERLRAGLWAGVKGGHPIPKNSLES